MTQLPYGSSSLTASPKGRIVNVSEMKIQTAFGASSADVSPSYRGFTVQWTPTPPPKLVNINGVGGATGVNGQQLRVVVVDVNSFYVNVGAPGTYTSGGTVTCSTR
jgi:hypothetical protein